MASPILYSGEDYLALPREPQPWVIKKLIPVSGLVNMYGPPKSRKSYAALGMAEAIASGRPHWNQLPVMKHGPVVYIQADTPREEWGSRIARMKKFNYHINRIYFADRLTIPSYPLNVLDMKQVEKLKLAIDDIKPVLVVIDTLRESFRGDENSSDIMQTVTTNIVSMAMNSAILLISHKRKDNVMQKDNLQDDLMEDARGSGYVSGRMDNIIRVTERRLTVKGRAVKQTSWDIEEAPDFDEDDPNAPPPMIIFEDDGSALLEQGVQELLQLEPAISLKAAAERLVAEGKSRHSVDHLRKALLPKLFRKYLPAVAA
jgi:RecA-family ATPase